MGTEKWQSAHRKCLIQALCRKLLVSILEDARWLDADFAANIKYMSSTFSSGDCMYILGENTSIPFKIHAFGQKQPRHIWINNSLQMNTQNYRSFKWCSKATLPLQIWIQGEISLPAHSQSKIIISMNTFLEKKIKTTKRRI